MIGEKNATYLYVANITNGYDNAASMDFTSMPLGSAAVVKAQSDASGGNEVEEDALVAGQKYFVVAKTENGELRRSPMFTSADVVGKSLKTYEQPVQQVSFLGYNGTAVNGLGAFVAENEYIIRLNLKHTQNTLNNTPEIKHLGYYALGTGQAAGAKAFMESFLRNFSPTREPYPTILCDRVVRTDSVAVIDATAVVYKVTKGSKNVTGHLLNQAAGATRLLALTAQDITALTAEDVLAFPSYNGRSFTATIDQDLGATAGAYHVIIGETNYVVLDAGAAADNLTAIVDAINAGTQATASEDAAVLTITYREGVTAPPPIIGYRDTTDAGELTAVAVAHATTNDRVPVVYTAATTIANANNFNLDEPWQGPTGYVRTAVSADAATSLIATTCGVATPNAAATWGLKFSGLYNSTFNPVTDTPDIIEFDVLAGDLVNSTEYKAVKPYKGTGSWREIAALENYAQGMDRFYMADDMITRREFNATRGKNYDMISLSLSTSPYTSATTGQKLENPFTINLALANSITTYDALNTVFGVS